MQTTACTVRASPEWPAAGDFPAHVRHFVAADYADLLRRNGLDEPLALLSATGESLAKPGLHAWRERLRLRLREDGRERDFYLKRFHQLRAPWPLRWPGKRLGPGGRGMATLEMAWLKQLGAAGIACPQVVAFAEACGSVGRVGALLMTAVPGRSLQNWCAARATRADRELIRRLGFFIGRFHRAGFVHRDLYVSHVFYDEGATTDPFHLIDLQRVFRPRLLRRRWIVKDLASLNYSTPARVATRTDRLRWLRSYLGLPRLNRSAERLARSVTRKTARIAAHDRSRRARLHAGGAKG